MVRLSVINELWLTRVEACWQSGAHQRRPAGRTYIQINRSTNLSSLSSFSFLLFFCPFPSSTIYFSHSIYRSVSFRTTASNRLPFSVRHAKELAITTTTHVRRGRTNGRTCAGRERVMKRAGNERRVTRARILFHLGWIATASPRSLRPVSSLPRSLALSLSGDSVSEDRRYRG